MGKREARTLPQGDFLTVNFKCLVGMRTGPLMASDCFLPAAIRDADAARIGCKWWRKKEGGHVRTSVTSEAGREGGKGE